MPKQFIADAFEQLGSIPQQMIQQAKRVVSPDEAIKQLTGRTEEKTVAGQKPKQGNTISPSPKAPSLTRLEEKDRKRTAPQRSSIMRELEILRQKQAQVKGAQKQQAAVQTRQKREEKTKELWKEREEEMALGVKKEKFKTERFRGVSG